MKIKKMIPAYLAALGYALVVGFSFLFTKVSLDQADPIYVLTYRFIASFITISILAMLGIVKVDLSKEKIKNILPLAILYPMLFFLFQTLGLQYASSSEGGIIMATAPVFTMILASYFLKEKYNLIQKVSMIISILGVVFIAYNKGENIDISNLIGLILLLVSTLSFSGYSVLARKVTQDYDTLEISSVMIGLSTIVFTIASIYKMLTSTGISGFIAPLTDKLFILSILYLGVLATLGTSILSSFALSRLKASQMTVFSNLATVISIVAGAVLLGEPVYYYHIVGSVLIIIGVLGTNLGN